MPVEILKHRKPLVRVAGLQAESWIQDFQHEADRIINTAVPSL